MINRDKDNQKLIQFDNNRKFFPFFNSLSILLRRFRGLPTTCRRLGAVAASTNVPAGLLPPLRPTARCM
jgi:hypothetical protein